MPHANFSEETEPDFPETTHTTGCWLWPVRLS